MSTITFSYLLSKHSFGDFLYSSLTVLKKPQPVVQIVPIHGDQSHDDVAVTCHI